MEVKNKKRPVHLHAARTPPPPNILFATQVHCVQDDKKTKTIKKLKCCERIINGDYAAIWSEEKVLKWVFGLAEQFSVGENKIAIEKRVMDGVDHLLCTPEIAILLEQDDDDLLQFEILQLRNKNLELCMTMAHHFGKQLAKLHEELDVLESPTGSSGSDAIGPRSRDDIEDQISELQVFFLFFIFFF